MSWVNSDYNLRIANFSCNIPPTVQIKIKFPFCIRRTLCSVITEGMSPSPSVINMSNCSSGGSC